MARRVEFISDHDHKWPSRAVTAFKAGWSGLVKDEVAERALAKGVAVIVEKDDEGADAPDSPDRPADGMVQPDLPDSGRDGGVPDVGTGGER